MSTALSLGWRTGSATGKVWKALQRAVVLFCFVLVVGDLLASPSGEALTALRAKRRELAHRPRRLIYDNDGNDHQLARSGTREAFLDCRVAPLAGSQVDTVVYCTTAGGFGKCINRSQEFEVLIQRDLAYGRTNWVADYLEQGTDPLRMTMEWCRKHGREIFCSLRMNDVHDGIIRDGALLYPYLFSNFKREHPQVLMGTLGKSPRYGSWSAVDYGEAEVRDRVVRYLAEVCKSYDVDGIELDFFRSLVFFRPVAQGGEAGNTERGTMTDMMRQIRRMTEEEGLRRGRPILLSARTPDSAGFCRAIGLDLEQWMREGLLDIWVAGGDFRLNPWSGSTRLGHQHGLAVWCDLDPVVRDAAGRWDRNAIECLRARALEAWSEGADAVYLFNFENTKSSMWRELGDPQALAKADKAVFANVIGRSGFFTPNSVLANGGRFETLSTVHPKNPMPLPAGRTQSVVVLVYATGTRCHLQVNGVKDARVLQVRVNGAVLSGGVLHEDWWEAALPPRMLRRGPNTFAVCFTPASTVEKVEDRTISLADVVLTSDRQGKRVRNEELPSHP